MPRSITQMRLARPYLPSIISTMSSTVVTSAVLPADTSYPMGRPSGVTTRPMLTRDELGLERVTAG